MFLSRSYFKMKKIKLTKEMKESLGDYYTLIPSNPRFRNAKLNFIKKWRMSPGYMRTMYK